MKVLTFNYTMLIYYEKRVGVMKKYFVYDKPKYKINKVNIVNNEIMVKHESMIEPCKINLAELFDETDSKNEVISELTDITGGYCNKYLKNILKNYRTEFLINWDDSIYNEFNTELTNNFNKYTTIYDETELTKIIFNFGKSINTLSKIDFDEIYNENDDIEYLFQRSLSLMIKNLSTKIKRLEHIIEKFIYKIGIDPKINKKNSSNWNMIIYVSLLSYLYKETVFGTIDIKFNLLVLLKYVLLKLNSYTSNGEYAIIKYKKDTKEVIKIGSIIPFIIYYLENHYYYKQYYDDWITDNKKDELDDFRNYVINNTKSSSKRTKYQLYDYKKIDDLYNRKIKDY